MGYFYFHRSFPLDFFIVVCQYIDMICINCFHEKTKIINSRQNKKSPIVWRRHYCPQCQQSFTTYEQPTSDNLKIIKGSSEIPFNLGKLIISIARSFQHSKQQGDKYSYDLAATVSQKLAKKSSISSRDLASLCLSTLEAFDHIAALQYAAQHNLIINKKLHKKATFYRSDDESDRSSQQ